MTTFLFKKIDKSVNNIRDFKWKNLALFIRSEFLKAQNFLTFGYHSVTFMSFFITKGNSSAVRAVKKIYAILFVPRPITFVTNLKHRFTD